jgi:predicted ATPase/transcriptional regulator with XRE-family HTH domain
MTRSFGVLLRELRLVEGITQAILAERAGVSERTIQELERRAVRPRRDTVRRLIAALNPPSEARVQLEAVTPSPRRRAASDAGALRQGWRRRRSHSRERRPGELPMPRSRLIGREQETAAIRRLLLNNDVAHVTLTGTAGVGKTCLALQVAAELHDAFSDGVYLVELAPISDPPLVVSTIAQVLGVPAMGDRPVLDALREHLRSRTVLLVLDNFEQVLAAAPVVSDLLTTSPGLKVVVTSREPLRLRGEREYRVLPLTLPDPHHPPALETLADYGAVALFVARARAIRADFALTAEDAAAVVEICSRLDGLPLAIELAAARVRMLTPQAIVARLERRLPLLTGGTRDGPERQRTLRDAIAWSHDLLSEPERRLFCRLSAFVGGWTLEAAEAVCDPEGNLGFEILDGLESLVLKSLINERADASGEPRFRMLETIREYGLQVLEASGELETVRRRHAGFFLALAERAEPELRGPHQVRWVQRLEAEHDNVRAILAWSLTNIHEAALALQLSGALYRFWQVRHLGEGYRWLRRVLDAVAVPGVVDQPHLHAVHAKVLNGAGVLARDLGDLEVARRLLEGSLALRRILGDRWALGQSLNNLAAVAIAEQDFLRAEPLVLEIVSLWQELGDSWGLTRGYGLLGLMLAGQGRLDEATQALHRSLALARSCNDIQGIGLQLHHLGSLAVITGDHVHAERLLHESASLQRRKGDLHSLARVLNDLAVAKCGLGEPEHAAALLRESIDLFRELGSTGGVGESFRRLADVAVANGQPRRAARLLGAAEAVGGSVGAFDSTGWAPSPQEYEARVRAELSDQDFMLAWAEGREMTLEQAVAYAAEDDTPA